MPDLHRRFFAVAVAAVLIAGAPAAFAVDIAPGGNLRSAIAALKPGEELRLAGGTYTVDSGFRVTVNGTAQQPIVMRSKDGERAIARCSAPPTTLSSTSRRSPSRARSSRVTR